MPHSFAPTRSRILYACLRSSLTRITFGSCLSHPGSRPVHGYRLYGQSPSSSCDRGIFKYDYIDGVESLEKYRLGGYHPIQIGDVLNGRYRIVHKLGYGGFSTVWLAVDNTRKHYVAVKIGISDSRLDEVATLRALSPQGQPPLHSSLGCPAILPVLDEFRVTGPNGTHPCYTTILARCNLRDVSFSRLFPIRVARALSYGVTSAVAYTHARGYAHGDIHLGNVLAKMPRALDDLSIEELYNVYGHPESVPVTCRDGTKPPSGVPTNAVVPLSLGINAKRFTLADARVLLHDYGEAFKPCTQSRLAGDCRTPHPGMPPEAIFEPESPSSYSADIWSLATTIWEIVGMKAIFDSTMATDDEIIAQQIDMFGPLPESWWAQWTKRGEFFDDDDGTPKQHRHVYGEIKDEFEERVQKYRRAKGTDQAFESAEVKAILELLQCMLRYRPKERITAEEVLGSAWMSKWCLPDFEQSLVQTRA